jgi:polyhydroxyalkanoate synthase
VAEENPATTDGWLAQAAKRQGSWWPDYSEWLKARSGEPKAAPKTLGSRKYKPTVSAPGTYVHAG